MANVNPASPAQALSVGSGGNVAPSSMAKLFSQQKSDTSNPSFTIVNGTGHQEKEGTSSGISPLAPFITSSGSKTGFTTVVNVSASEDNLHSRNKENEEEDVFIKEADGPNSSPFKDHTYTLRQTLSSKGRPLKRSKACGECDGCIRPNCNKCRFCLDKPKNGGPNRLKKRCVHRVCTRMVPGASIDYGQKPSLLSASSVGEEDEEYEDAIDAPPPANNEAEQGEQMETDKHTAIVTVDDTSSSPSPLRPRRAKVMPKKFQADYAVAYKLGKRSKYMNSSTSIATRNLKRINNDVVIRHLRRRQGVRQPENAATYIDDMPSRGKFASLRKQLKIDMAAPGTTLTSKRSVSNAVVKNIHIRKSTPGEDRPASGKLSPVPQPVLATWVTRVPQSGAPTVAVLPPQSKESSQIASAAAGLSMLASGASERPKLPSSPIVAKLQALELPADPQVWSVQEVQRFLSDIHGLTEIAAQLHEEEVDGTALLELTPVWLTQCLKIKLGPAIKLCKHIEDLRVRVEAAKVSF